MTAHKTKTKKIQPPPAISEIAKILSEAIKRLSAVRTPIRAN